VSGEDQSAAEFFISDVMWNTVLSVRERSLLGGIDIQPGNGAGQFLQLRSPHGASDQGKHCLTEGPSIAGWTCCM